MSGIEVMGSFTLLNRGDAEEDRDADVVDDWLDMAERLAIAMIGLHERRSCYF